MYNSLYYIFTKDYNTDYSEFTLYLKDKNNRLKILNDSKDKEIKYLKKKYNNLIHHYNYIEWKYDELRLNNHYNREHYKKLEIKYNSLLKNYNSLIDNKQTLNDDYEHL
jgi:homoserine trans-succinylase